MLYAQSKKVKVMLNVTRFVRVAVAMGPGYPLLTFDIRPSEEMG